MRTLAAHLLALGVALVAVKATAQSVTGFPPPAQSPGTEVNGTVRLPNGSLAGQSRSVLERFAALIGEYFVDAGFRLILFKVNLTGGDYTVTLTVIPSEASAQTG